MTVDTPHAHPKTASRAAWGDLVALVALAGAFRALFWAAMPRVIDTADAIHYLETAQHFAAGDFAGYDPKIPILYPLLAAVFHLVFPDMEMAGRMVSFVASVCAVVPVYLLARAMHGRAAARLAGVAVALWPWLADYACRVSTEATASLWWFLGAWLLYRAVEKGGRWAWAAPWPFFALYLTRAEGLFLWLAAPIAALPFFFGKKAVPARRIAPFLGLSALLLALGTLHVRWVTGETTANYRVGFILEEFDLLRFGDTFFKTLSEVFPIMLGPVLLLFLGAGFFWPRGPGDLPRRPRLETYVLLLCAAQWTCSLFVLSPAPRYLMAPLMALASWSAAGMAHVSAWAAPAPGGRFWRILPAAALVLSMLASAAVTVGSEHLGRRPREPREYKEAGLWMRDHLEPGLIFTRKPQVAYYAQMPSTGPALEDSLEAALDRAKNAGARYLVIDERYAPPALRPLLDPVHAPPGLRCLQSFDSYPECGVVVYELGAQP